MFVLIFHGIISTSQPQHSAIKTFLFLKTTMSNFLNRVLVFQFYVSEPRGAETYNLLLKIKKLSFYTFMFQCQPSHFLGKTFTELLIQKSLESRCM